MGGEKSSEKISGEGSEKSEKDFGEKKKLITFATPKKSKDRKRGIKNEISNISREVE